MVEKVFARHNQKREELAFIHTQTVSDWPGQLGRQFPRALGLRKGT